jgi:large subunit ribosomal protein L7Ae
MPIYERFETPEEIVNKVYQAIEKARDTGKVSKGTNEVTKQAERKQAKLVVMATDVSPEEILAHIPLLCEEKGVPYGYVPSKEELGRAAGLKVSTASIAVTDPGEGESLIAEIVKSIKEIKGS